MTSEQEDAAKWRTLEEYRKLRQRVDVLQAKLIEWGQELQRIGARLAIETESVQEGEVTAFPDPKELASTITELHGERSTLDQLTRRLRDLGIHAKDLHYI